MAKNKKNSTLRLVPTPPSTHPRSRRAQKAAERTEKQKKTSRRITHVAASSKPPQAIVPVDDTTVMEEAPTTDRSPDALTVPPPDNEPTLPESLPPTPPPPPPQEERVTARPAKNRTADIATVAVALGISAVIASMFVDWSNSDAPMVRTTETTKASVSQVDAPAQPVASPPPMLAKSAIAVAERQDACPYTDADCADGRVMDMAACRCMDDPEKVIQNAGKVTLKITQPVATATTTAAPTPVLATAWEPPITADEQADATQRATALLNTETPAHLVKVAHGALRAQVWPQLATRPQQDAARIAIANVTGEALRFNTVTDVKAKIAHITGRPEPTPYLVDEGPIVH